MEKPLWRLGSPVSVKQVLVTGEAGFIGSHLVDRLVAEGFDVTVIEAGTLMFESWRCGDSHELFRRRIRSIRRRI
jgi:dTDP-D-glucose 4,6-dehydratase